MPWFLALSPFARRALIIGGAAIAILAAFGLWLHMHDKAVVEADRSAANAKAVSTAREADERAQEAGNRKSEDVEDANDRAREAADGSDDPLADGLRSLRRKAH
jgi:hypothetical protein